MDKEGWSALEKQVDGESGVAAPETVATPAVTEAKPADATPTPEAAPAAPAAAASDTPEAKPADTTAEKPEEPPRDDKGRYVKVSVHAREMSKRDAEIATLREQLASVQAKPETPKSIAEFDKLREQFKGNFPEEFQQVFGVMEQQLLTRDEENAKLKQVLARFEEAEKAKADEASAKATEEAIGAIAAVPTLKAWQEVALGDQPTEEATALWNAAVKHDTVLREFPAWRDKPMQERFKEAALRTARDFGLTIPEATPSPAAPPPHKPLPEQKLPASLSNVPGGIAPRDPVAGVDVANPMALSAMMAGWSDQQVNDYFAKRYSA